MTKTPTHRCKICGALWRQFDDGSWNLCSPKAGPCCDNAAMHDQIEPLAKSSPAPQEKAIREALPVAAWMKVSKAHMPRMRMLNEVHVQGVWDVELVQKSDAEAQLAELRAEVERLRNVSRKASELLKRAPRATMDMFIGRDRKSFGSQAKEAFAAIDAALAAKESEHG